MERITSRRTSRTQRPERSTRGNVDWHSRQDANPWERHSFQGAYLHTLRHVQRNASPDDYGEYAATRSSSRGYWRNRDRPRSPNAHRYSGYGGARRSRPTRARSLSPYRRLSPEDGFRRSGTMTNHTRSRRRSSEREEYPFTLRDDDSLHHHRRRIPPIYPDGTPYPSPSHSPDVSPDGRRGRQPLNILQDLAAQGMGIESDDSDDDTEPKHYQTWKEVFARLCRHLRFDPATVRPEHSRHHGAMMECKSLLSSLKSGDMKEHSSLNGAIKSAQARISTAYTQLSDAWPRPHRELHALSSTYRIAEEYLSVSVRNKTRCIQKFRQPRFGRSYTYDYQSMLKVANTCKGLPVNQVWDRLALFVENERLHYRVLPEVIPFFYHDPEDSEAITDLVRQKTKPGPFLQALAEYASSAILAQAKMKLKSQKRKQGEPLVNAFHRAQRHIKTIVQEMAPRAREFQKIQREYDALLALADPAIKPKLKMRFREYQLSDRDIDVGKLAAYAEELERAQEYSEPTDRPVDLKINEMSIQPQRMESDPPQGSNQSTDFFRRPFSQDSRPANALKPDVSFRRPFQPDEEPERRAPTPTQDNRPWHNNRDRADQSYAPRQDTSYNRDDRRNGHQSRLPSRDRGDPRDRDSQNRYDPRRQDRRPQSEDRGRSFNGNYNGSRDWDRDRNRRGYSQDRGTSNRGYRGRDYDRSSSADRAPAGDWPPFYRTDRRSNSRQRLYVSVQDLPQYGPGPPPPPSRTSYPATAYAPQMPHQGYSMPYNPQFANAPGAPAAPHPVVTPPSAPAPAPTPGYPGQPAPNTGFPGPAAAAPAAPAPAIPSPSGSDWAEVLKALQRNVPARARSDSRDRERHTSDTARDRPRRPNATVKTPQGSDTSEERRERRRERSPSPYRRLPSDSQATSPSS